MEFAEEDAISYNELMFVIPEQVYSPAEDTDLCVKILLDWADHQSESPRILELGIGPGTLSLLLADYLAKNGLIPQIIGSDINPLAVEVATLTRN